MERNWAEEKVLGALREWGNPASLARLSEMCRFGREDTLSILVNLEEQGTVRRCKRARLNDEVWKL